MNRNQKILLFIITVGAFLLRLPHWEVIPASFDEVNQTSFALLIAQGQSFPLVANDAYTGPFYVYLLAAILKFGVTNPMLGRIVVMVTGTLLVPITFLWVRILGDESEQNGNVAGWIAAGLVTVNPDLILVNSHIGGATFLLPFFTTLFFLTATLAIRRDSLAWPFASGAIAGLALQSNPIAGLAIAGGFLWLLWRAKRSATLGRSWPLYPILAGLVVILIYSPVIAYNLNSDFQTVNELEERSYLWEQNPTIETTQANGQRFALQTIRQVSGVVQGDETFATLVGFPLVVLVCMVAGLIYTTRSVSWLPLFILVPYSIVLPIFSHHYGFVSVGRFTTLLIPVWASVIGWGLARAFERISQAWPKPSEKSGFKGWLMPLAAVAGLFILFAYPVNNLSAFYQTQIDENLTGRPLLELSRYVVDQSQGEPVYISPIGSLGLRGVPYVPHAAFVLADIHHEFLPASQIIGRLYAQPDAAYLILNNQDRDQLANIFSLERVEVDANEMAAAQNFGLFRVEDTQAAAKPDFVLATSDVPADIGPSAILNDALQLLGCEFLHEVAAENQILLECYWTIIGEIEPAEHIGFAHLFDPGNSTLVAQDDHILGKELYPMGAWQPGEVIKEGYVINVPSEAQLSDLQLMIGVYTWPELVRFTVPDNPDNVVIVPIEIGP